MKRHILTSIIFAALLSGAVSAQSNDTILSSYTNQTEIVARNSITLKPGFHIPTGKTVRIYTNSSLVNFPNLQTQLSAGQNYILTRIFREPVTVAQLGQQRTVGQENQTVQYFDGLGRPLQTLQVQGSPGYKDIVQHIEYDSFGRESRKYLPYSENTATNGVYRANAAMQVLNYYADPAAGKGWDTHVKKTANPYAVTVFENSPLNRVLEQGAPGAAWQPSATPGAGHTVKTTYGSNTASGLDVVRLWSVTPTGATGATNYAAGKLYRTTLRDENSTNTTSRAGSVDEYKDFEDRVVLKRVWESETKALNTYYVYDDFGDLRYVIPPAVTTTSFTEADAGFTNYIYAYRYDGRRRLIEKKIPGKGWEYLVYNKNDQEVLTQDSVQRARKEWTYTRYDAFGRITSTGLYTNTVKFTVKDIRGLVDAATGPLWETRNGADYPSPATTFPLAGTGITIIPHIIHYYDDYSFTGAATLPVSAINRSTMTRSLQTGTRVYRTDGTLPLLTVLYYDDYGRIIQTAANNHLEGKDYITNTFNFVGELLTSTRVHTPKTGAATTIITTNTYDHVGRLTATKERIGSQPEVILASNTYNEIGQLKARYMGKAGTETAYVDSTTYTYNERGWAKRIASTNFTQSLMYEDGGTVRQWNGNIAQQSWRFGAPPAVTSTFEYSYDKLNRLLSGASTPAGAASMSEVITYDNLGMGNINTLKRDAGAVTTYAYTGNRLTSLAGGVSGSYTYDGNGNAKTDRTGMAFTYNYLNLPQTATKSGTSVSYLYDALGTKLRKTAKIGTTTAVTTTRDYVDGIEYNGANIDIIHNGVGYALRSGTSYVYHYNLTDHLGNVRTTLKRGGTATAVDVVQRDNYYPFGMRKVVAAGTNKYLYNGKEIQGELGDQYDYGARFYDPVIGRWNVVDPLAEQYRRWSPYNYTMNNPIRFIDPDGMRVDDFIFNENGDYVRTEDNDRPHRLVVENSKTGDRQSYQFADPEADSKAIADGTVNKLVFVGKSQVSRMLRQQGVFDPENKDNWSNFYNESTGGGKYDYSYSVIPDEFESQGAVNNPLSNPSPILFLAEGDNMVHNQMNFGNYLWAASGFTLGFNYSILKAAAHGNSVLNSRSNGYSPQFDSQDDQRSIVKGAYFSDRNGYRKILDNAARFRDFKKK